MPSAWTEEAEDLLVKLWSEKKQSGFIIKAMEDELGIIFTRNAIAGKVSRMKLEGHRQTSRNSERPIHHKPKKDNTHLARNTPRKKKHNDGIIQPPRVQQEVIIPTQPLKVSLLELTSNTCRWPLGTPGDRDFCFCGLPPKDGLPYCPDHCQIAYQPYVRR